MLKLNFFLLIVFIPFVFLNCQSQKINDKPNVIIIYTDDQGSIDLNIYGAKDLVTPHMDALVRGGVRFTQFYGAPVCSPSRASLMTGKTPQRAGVPGNIPSVPVTERGLSGSQYTMAEMFKDADYKTAHIGKWHLGDQPGMLPNDQGFDYSFGHHVGCIDNYSHFYYWRGPNRHDLYRNGKEVFYDGQFFPQLMVEEATAFIEENKEDPFFMYFAMNTPHYPYQGTPEWLKYYQDKGVAYPRDLYAAFLSTQDDKIGALIAKLESLDLMENTIIVFQADNGYSTEERAHFGGGNAGPYRGAKSCLFEGGYRVPAAITWRGNLPENEIRGQFSVNADWMPTLAALCNIDLDTQDLDGKSLVAVINDPEAKSQHNEIFTWQHGKQWATRSGKWKLLGNPVDKTNKSPLTEKDKLFLVDLEKDPGEMNNLAETYPEKVKELESQYLNWLITTEN
ncbi:MAG: arylsulfatase A [Saprospiraceae bacterium]|jgi:arylsulfatase A